MGWVGVWGVGRGAWGVERRRRGVSGPWGVVRLGVLCRGVRCGALEPLEFGQDGRVGHPA